MTFLKDDYAQVSVPIMVLNRLVQIAHKEGLSERHLKKIVIISPKTATTIDYGYVLEYHENMSASKNISEPYVDII